MKAAERAACARLRVDEDKEGAHVVACDPAHLISGNLCPSRLIPAPDVSIPAPLGPSRPLSDPFEMNSHSGHLGSSRVLSPSVPRPSTRRCGTRRRAKRGSGRGRAGRRPRSSSRSPRLRRIPGRAQTRRPSAGGGRRVRRRRGRSSGRRSRRVSGPLTGTCSRVAGATSCSQPPGTRRACRRRRSVARLRGELRASRGYTGSSHTAGHS